MFFYFMLRYSNVIVTYDFSQAPFRGAQLYPGVLSERTLGYVVVSARVSER